jgi:1-acyl-sn-glycerol-3-phosphate acyltransferase
MNPETTLPSDEIRPVDPRDQMRYPLYQTALHKLAVTILSAFFRLAMKLEVDGLDNLPKDGGVVVAANHLTSFDIFPLQIALPRPIFYMGKAELFKNPLVHFLFRNMGAFPVYRGERDEWAIAHAQQVLEAGQVLGMFPEGTRSHGHGLRVAKTGAARLAIATNSPVVPVAVDGSQRFFRRFPHRTRVMVRICEPVHPEPDEMPLELTDRFMFRLAQNLPVDLKGVYTEKPVGFDS